MNQNDIFDLSIQIIDISNIQETIINDSSRNLIIQELNNFNNFINFNNFNNFNTLDNRNFILNLLENNIQNLLQNIEQIEQENSESGLDNFIDSTIETDNKKKFKRVIDAEEYKNLKIQKYDKNTKYGNTECPICLNEFKIDDEIIVLPCNHIYYPDLIKKWLNEESNSCPICRYEFNFKVINTEFDLNNQLTGYTHQTNENDTNNTS